MLRRDLNEALKNALREKDTCAVRTLRLILAALKDKELSARTNGTEVELADEDILGMLTTMVKQRREAIRMFEEGGRCELAEQEREEITVIERFMPAQLNGDELDEAVRAVIDEVGAENLKDMGRTMAALKSRYAGQMDFSKASGVVRQVLA
jgi:uncharacterized protein YqeY